MRRSSVLVALGMALGAVVAPVAQVATATPAAAATTPMSSVEASLTGHRGTNGSNVDDGTTAANCVRFAGPTTTGGTGWSTGEVAAAHGAQRIDTQRRSRNSWFSAWGPWGAIQQGNTFRCPSTIGRGFIGDGSQSDLFGNEETREVSQGQSVLGLTPSPAGTVTTGGPFLLATLRHYNNPITSGANYFEGTSGFRFNLGATPVLISSSYRLHETPNASNPSTDRASDDIVLFNGLVGPRAVTVNGLSYRLTVDGFTTMTTGSTACGGTPSGSFSNQVQTVEQTTTVACLWARLDVVRDLQVVNVTQSAGAQPAAVPAMAFASTSTVPGTFWATGKTLTPSSTVAPNNSSSAIGSVQSGETVTISKPALQPGWELTSVACLDGTTPVAAEVAQFSTATGRLTVNELPAPPTGSTAPVVCTFVHTYVAPTTLTLISTTTTGTTTAAAAGWGFTVREGTTVLATGTTAGSPAKLDVTSLGSLAANRTVTVAETVPAGYVVDKMTCTSTKPGSTPVVTANPVQLPLERGWSYTCTADNLTTGVTVTKEAFADAARTQALPTGAQRTAGTTVYWRYTVRNTGQATLARVRLQDDVTATTNATATTPAASTSGRTTITCPGLPAAQVVTIASIAPGASVVCTASGVM
ncbi:choice-of-anchor K domain-containing protein [Cellulomonas sp. 179-A 9B4 NHS]|uniref:prealbumin-like fold domain-containing protein n=1 Tax=Cellulomonas sp. 179-A 9B4 NHS TaxID=3142379 RepID=UPI0039A2043B